MMTAEELKAIKIDTPQMRAVFRAYGMMRDRATFYGKDAMGYAYEGVATLLEYTMTENWEALNQFDYFNKED